MAFENKENNDAIRILTLILFTLPFATSANVNCDGKSFHCVNSTHFMICVDLGGGVSSTIDSFVIQCPPTTECQATNRFECEFPSVPAVIDVVTSASSATELLETVSDFPTLYYQVSDVRLSDKNFESTLRSQNSATEGIPVERYVEVLTTENLKRTEVFTLETILQNTSDIMSSKYTDINDLSKNASGTIINPEIVIATAIPLTETDFTATVTNFRNTDRLVPSITFGDKNVTSDLTSNGNLSKDSDKEIIFGAGTTYDTTETHISTLEYQLTTESAKITTSQTNETINTSKIMTPDLLDSSSITTLTFNGMNKNELITTEGIKNNLTDHEAIRKSLYNEPNTFDTTTSNSIKNNLTKVMNPNQSVNISAETNVILQNISTTDISSKKKVPTTLTATGQNNVSNNNSNRLLNFPVNHILIENYITTEQRLENEATTDHLDVTNLHMKNNNNLEKIIVTTTSKSILLKELDTPTTATLLNTKAIRPNYATHPSLKYEVTTEILIEPTLQVNNISNNVEMIETVTLNSLKTIPDKYIGSENDLMIEQELKNNVTVEKTLGTTLKIHSNSKANEIIVTTPSQSISTPNSADNIQKNMKKKFEADGSMTTVNDASLINKVSREIYIGSTIQINDTSNIVAKFGNNSNFTSDNVLAMQQDLKNKVTTEPIVKTTLEINGIHQAKESILTAPSLSISTSYTDFEIENKIKQNEPKNATPIKIYTNPPIITASDASFKNEIMTDSDGVENLTNENNLILSSVLAMQQELKNEVTTEPIVETTLKVNSTNKANETIVTTFSPSVSTSDSGLVIANKIEQDKPINVAIIKIDADGSMITVTDANHRNEVTTESSMESTSQINKNSNCVENLTNENNLISDNVLETEVTIEPIVVTTMKTNGNNKADETIVTTSSSVSTSDSGLVIVNKTQQDNQINVSIIKSDTDEPIITVIDANPKNEVTTESSIEFTSQINNRSNVVSILTDENNLISGNNLAMRQKFKNEVTTEPTSVTTLENNVYNKADETTVATSLKSISTSDSRSVTESVIKQNIQKKFSLNNVTTKILIVPSLQIYNNSNGVEITEQVSSKSFETADNNFASDSSKDLKTEVGTEKLVGTTLKTIVGNNAHETTLTTPSERKLISYASLVIKNETKQYTLKNSTLSNTKANELLSTIIESPSLLNQVTTDISILTTSQRNNSSNSKVFIKPDTPIGFNITNSNYTSDGILTVQHKVPTGQVAGSNLTINVSNKADDIIVTTSKSLSTANLILLNETVTQTTLNILKTDAKELLTTVIEPSSRNEVASETLTMFYPEVNNSSKVKITESTTSNSFKTVTDNNLNLDSMFAMQQIFNNEITTEHVVGTNIKNNDSNNVNKTDVTIPSLSISTADIVLVTEKETEENILKNATLSETKADRLVSVTETSLINEVTTEILIEPTLQVNNISNNVEMIETVTLNSLKTIPDKYIGSENDLMIEQELKNNVTVEKTLGTTLKIHSNSKANEIIVTTPSQSISTPNSADNIQKNMKKKFETDGSMTTVNDASLINKVSREIYIGSTMQINDTSNIVAKFGNNSNFTSDNVLAMQQDLKNKVTTEPIVKTTLEINGIHQAKESILTAPSLSISTSYTDFEIENKIKQNEPKNATPIKNYTKGPIITASDASLKNEITRDSDGVENLTKENYLILSSVLAMQQELKNEVKTESIVGTTLKVNGTNKANETIVTTFSPSVSTSDSGLVIANKIEQDKPINVAIIKIDADGPMITVTDANHRNEVTTESSMESTSQINKNSNCVENLTNENNLISDNVLETEVTIEPIVVTTMKTNGNNKADETIVTTSSSVSTSDSGLVIVNKTQQDNQINVSIIKSDTDGPIITVIDANPKNEVTTESSIEFTSQINNRSNVVSILTDENNLISGNNLAMRQKFKNEVTTEPTSVTTSENNVYNKADETTVATSLKSISTSDSRSVTESVIKQNIQKKFSLNNVTTKILIVPSLQIYNSSNGVEITEQVSSKSFETADNNFASDSSKDLKTEVGTEKLVGTTLKTIVGNNAHETTLTKPSERKLISYASLVIKNETKQYTLKNSTLSNTKANELLSTIIESPSLLNQVTTDISILTTSQRNNSSNSKVLIKPDTPIGFNITNSNYISDGILTVQHKVPTGQVAGSNLTINGSNKADDIIVTTSKSLSTANLILLNETVTQTTLNISNILKTDAKELLTTVIEPSSRNEVASETLTMFYPEVNNSSKVEITESTTSNSFKTVTDNNLNLDSMFAMQQIFNNEITTEHVVGTNIKNNDSNNVNKTDVTIPSLSISTADIVLVTEKETEENILKNATLSETKADRLVSVTETSLINEVTTEASILFTSQMNNSSNGVEFIKPITSNNFKIKTLASENNLALQQKFENNVPEQVVGTTLTFNTSNNLDEIVVIKPLQSISVPDSDLLMNNEKDQKIQKHNNITNTEADRRTAMINEPHSKIEVTTDVSIVTSSLIKNTRNSAEKKKPGNLNSYKTTLDTLINLGSYKGQQELGYAETTERLNEILISIEGRNNMKKLIDPTVNSPIEDAFSNAVKGIKEVSDVLPNIKPQNNFQILGGFGKFIDSVTLERTSKEGKINLTIDKMTKTQKIKENALKAESLITTILPVSDSNHNTTLSTTVEISEISTRKRLENEVTTTTSSTMEHKYGVKVIKPSILDYILTTERIVPPTNDTLMSFNKPNKTIELATTKPSNNIMKNLPSNDSINMAFTDTSATNSSLTIPLISELPRHKALNTSNTTKNTINSLTDYTVAEATTSDINMTDSSVQSPYKNGVAINENKDAGILVNTKDSTSTKFLTQNIIVYGEIETISYDTASSIPKQLNRNNLRNTKPGTEEVLQMMTTEPLHSTASTIISDQLNGNNLHDLLKIGKEELLEIMTTERSTQFLMDRTITSNLVTKSDLLKDNLEISGTGVTSLTTKIKKEMVQQSSDRNTMQYNLNFNSPQETETIQSNNKDANIKYRIDVRTLDPGAVKNESSNGFPIGVIKYTNGQPHQSNTKTQYTDVSHTNVFPIDSLSLSNSQNIPQVYEIANYARGQMSTIETTESQIKLQETVDQPPFLVENNSLQEKGDTTDRVKGETGHYNIFQDEVETHQSVFIKDNSVPVSTAITLAGNIKKRNNLRGIDTSIITPSTADLNLVPSNIEEGQPSNNTLLLIYNKTKLSTKTDNIYEQDVSAQTVNRLTTEKVEERSTSNSELKRALDDTPIAKPAQNIINFGSIKIGNNEENFASKIQTVRSLKVNTKKGDAALSYINLTQTMTPLTDKTRFDSDTIVYDRQVSAAANKDFKITTPMSAKLYTEGYNKTTDFYVVNGQETKNFATGDAETGNKESQDIKPYQLKITKAPANLNRSKSDRNIDLEEKPLLNKVGQLQLAATISNLPIAVTELVDTSGNNVDSNNSVTMIPSDTKNVITVTLISGGKVSSVATPPPGDQIQNMENKNQFQSEHILQAESILNLQNTTKIGPIDEITYFYDVNNTTATEIVPTSTKEIKNHTPNKITGEQLLTDTVHVPGAIDLKSTSVSESSKTPFHDLQSSIPKQNTKSEKVDIATAITKSFSSDLTPLNISAITLKSQQLSTANGNSLSLIKKEQRMSQVLENSNAINKVLPGKDSELAKSNENGKTIENQRQAVEYGKHKTKSNLNINVSTPMPDSYNKPDYVKTAESYSPLLKLPIITKTTTIELTTNIEAKVKNSKIVPKIDTTSNKEALTAQNKGTYERSNTNRQAPIPRVSRLEDTISEAYEKHNIQNETQKTKQENSLISQNVSENHDKKNQEKRNVSGHLVKFYCRHKNRGRYLDREDCQKFYICIGKNEPIIGRCPANTVFSDIRKQCTKNLSHCVRQSEFRCMAQGRFSDIFIDNIYYICVSSGNHFIRFKFQCQNGYNLNKTSVRCYRQSESESNHESSTQSSEHSSKNNKSEKNRTQENKKRNNENKSVEFDCEDEGKFAHPNDCRKYYVCIKNKKSEFRRRRKKCDSDEVFHKDKKKCVDADSYEC